MQKLTEYLFVILVLAALAFGLNKLCQHYIVGLSEQTSDRIVRSAR